MILLRFSLALGCALAPLAALGSLAPAGPVGPVGPGAPAIPATPAPQDPGEARGPLSAEQLALEATLAEQGVRLDTRRGLVSIPAQVAVPDELLEYLLVGPAGASHESAFTTGVSPSVLNVALLALGLEAGANASWTPKDPAPSEEQLRAGVSPYDVHLPAGDGLYIYVAWRAGEELYFFRVEDLIRNLMRGHSMERHRWIYLGSRMVPDGKGGEDFAAEVYHNLICVSFFGEGYTLATGALEDCVEQTIWMANAWLLPEPGTAVRFLLARSPLDVFPADQLGDLPDVLAPEGSETLAPEGSEPR